MDKYNRYKNLFSGLDTVTDINFFIDRCDKNDENIINSIIPYTKQNNQVSLIDMYDIFDKIGKCKYRQDIENIMCSFKKYENNLLQRTIINDLMDIHPLHVSSFQRQLPNKIPQITKQCPHCGRETTVDCDICYIVCGFDPHCKLQPDYDGCSNDWCFKCGKKLCRNWFTDNLFNDINRIHNDICCKNHASNNKFKYPEEYCMCEQNRRANATKLIL